MPGGVQGGGRSPGGDSALRCLSHSPRGIASVFEAATLPLSGAISNARNT